MEEAGGEGEKTLLKRIASMLEKIIYLSSARIHSAAVFPLSRNLR